MVLIIDELKDLYHYVLKIVIFLTGGIIIYEIGIVTLLAPIFKHGVCILLGILIGEVTFGIAYYILLRYLLNKSEKDIAHSA